MSLQQQIVIRYRDDEHVRFELPASLFETAALDQLTEALRRIEGVYRVDAYPNQRKLSVRFMRMVVDFRNLARHLSAILDRLALAPKPCPACHPLERVETGLQSQQGNRLVRWLKEKYQEAKETVTAAGILVRAGRRGEGRAGFFPSSKAVNDFFTDILVLFLIKLHWHHILHVWLRQPWVYKYEWMATFYLIFLLMRSRLPQPQPQTA